MYDTVIFDLDGTLLNTLDDLCDSTNYALERHGYPARTLEQVRKFVGNGIKKLVERAVPEGTDETEYDGVLRDFRRHYQEHCNDKTRPYDGILPLLTELKNRGIKTGIVSNKDRQAVAELERIYFDGLTDGAEGASDGVPTKPDPAMTKALLERLGGNRENTLYVGDSQVDVQTAANAGIDMVAVLWGFRDREELEAAGAKRFIKKPMELLEYL